MGNIASIFSQSFPPKSKFNVEDIPDLSGKVAIVTGANAGLFQHRILPCIPLNIALFSQELEKKRRRQVHVNTNNVHVFDIVKPTGIAYTQRQGVRRRSQ